MFDKLAAIERQYDEVMDRLGTSEVQGDSSEYRKLAKSLSDIEPIVQRFREYRTVARDIAQTEELVSAGDSEMRALAQEELKSLTARRDALVSELKVLLVPKDPNDQKNVILEIRAGTGGDEAVLFVRAPDGSTPVAIVLTNLAAWFQEGALTIEGLREQIKGPSS